MYFQYLDKDYYNKFKSFLKFQKIMLFSLIIHRDNIMNYAFKYTIVCMMKILKTGISKSSRFTNNTSTNIKNRIILKINKVK